MLSLNEFTHQLFDQELRDQYRRDNDWVNTWADKWEDEEVMTRFIECAYKLYSAMATNALKMTFLGGTQIRMNQLYIQNFGVTAANGIQDRETRRLVREEQSRRRARAQFPRGRGGVFNPLFDGPGRTPDRALAPAPVTGGGILSEKGWTPILNDSLILGAISGRQEILLLLTSQEQKDWEVMNRASGKTTAEPRVAALSKKFESSSAVVEAWRSFLNSQRQMFFSGSTPRVFTRELLGLSFFGYKPAFSRHQFGFHAGADYGQRAGSRPDFKSYLRGLRNVNFHAKPADERKIMRAISVFLFSDPEALGSPWPAATRT